ncbi:MAG: hypothetical protein CM15mP120_21410 [Pseudomonadota bacterium]|nr:MAG: hypothetical protein CM15mP120_21410 [Pseudomonadota bacterium]
MRLGAKKLADVLIVDTAGPLGLGVMTRSSSSKGEANRNPFVVDAMTRPGP